MKIGKMATSELEKNVLSKINFHRDDVLVHAGIGEDSAVIDFGEEVLVISSDPITGAIQRLGYLAVHVACNDLAAAGARPVGIQVVLLLPPEVSQEELAELMQEIAETASSLQVEILGGHTEVLSAVSRPIITITAVGKAPRDRYLATGGAKPGDDLIITKGIGIEGTFILAADHPQYLIERGVSPVTIEKAEEYYHQLSVLPEGLLAAESGAHAMHDVTEGGLYGALVEMCHASGTGFEIEENNLAITPETREIARALEIDPAGLLSSGTMLISIPQGDRLIAQLQQQGITAYKIGRVIEQGQYLLKQDKKIELKWSGRDELWRVLEEKTLFS